MIREFCTILLSVCFLTSGCIGSQEEIDIFYGEDINPSIPANDFTLIDENGDIWVSTIFGISKFNPKTKQFRKFNEGNGLQSNEFNNNEIILKNMIEGTQSVHSLKELNSNIF